MTQRTQPLARLATAALAALALGTIGCNNTDSPNQTEIPEGTYNFDNNFFVDSNFGGNATEVRITRQFYGRLVTVASCTPAGGIIEFVQTDFLIDPRPEGSFSDPFTLTTNPVDGSQTLCIAEDINDTTVDPELGSSSRERFLAALTEVAGGVRPVSDLGFVGAGNFTMVPRNAAFAIQFDDIIDPDTLNPNSLRVVSGNPAIIPVTARVFADPNFGAMADFDGAPGDEFYPTRIIVDPAVSETEFLAGGNFPLNVDLTGFPASPAPSLANIQVRIPTELPIGQVQPILQNPSEHSLVTDATSGTFDFGSATRDIVRAFRSGGVTSITGDPFNGFLPDATPPSIIGTQGSSVDMIQSSAADPAEFFITVTFNSLLCAQEPQEGDVIITNSGISALVIRSDPNSTDLASGSLNGSGVATNVRVRVLTPIPAQFPQDDPGAAFAGNGSGPAQYTVVYNDEPFANGGDRNRPECFVGVSPTASLFPAAPNTGITSESEFTIRFSEPMNAELMEPYETIRLTRQRPVPVEPSDFVAGRLAANQGLQEFTFVPNVPLEHTNGSIESFFLSLPDTDFAPSDLAGNSLTARLQPFVEFTVEMTAATERTGSRAILFNSNDDEAPFGDLSSDMILDRLPRSEWAGQLSFNLQTGRIRPRPVVREQVFVSRGQEIVGQMGPGLGTNLPLNPRGARTQIIWRDIDFGLPLYEGNDWQAGLDVSRLNVDIESAYLSPLDSQPVVETIPQFSMGMAHSLFLPNENLANPPALTNPTSGLSNVFSGNLLDQSEDPLQEVHPRELGFTINPGDQSLTSDGLTTLIPLPLNQGLSEAEKRYYTWRDTAILSLGAPTTAVGAPVQRVSQVSQFYPFFNMIDMMTGMPICGQAAAFNPLYITDQVRTAGLPLLIDFRAFSGGTASSGNMWDHSVAFANSTFPAFRAFSAGGTNQGGFPVIVDPDNETSANGGFDPTSTPPGAETPGLDNTVYHGALDLVARISRTTSIFFPTTDPSSFDANSAGISNYPATYTDPSFVEPTLFPTANELPTGTSVEFAYRASAEIPLGSDERERADMMDPYGDFFPGLPINYTPPDPGGIPGQSEIGSASCFDGSFQYIFVDPMGNTLTNPNVTFIGGDSSWRDTVEQLRGARFFQIRMSFIGNLVTGETAELSSLGMSWVEN